jgi:hypothetical protein
MLVKYSCRYRSSEFVSFGSIPNREYVSAIGVEKTTSLERTCR